jgi:PEP-CTERM motif
MRLVRILVALAPLAFAALPAHATTFTDGEFITFSQIAWGQDPIPGNISFSLEENFDSVFPGGVLEVGIPGTAGFSLLFDGADAVITYLPASGAPGVLTADLLDPVSSPSGIFGGEVVTAELNVTFADDDLLAHPPGVTFGDLVFQNLDLFSAAENPSVGPEIVDFNGMSVREVLADANRLLGGAASPFIPGDIFALLEFTTRAFAGGEVEENADTFLAFPATAPVPEPSAWAMLLLGFAGLGFVRYRSSRSSSAAAGSRNEAQRRS